jgi:hypothetical protein
MARNDSGDKMYNDLKQKGEYRSASRVEQDKINEKKRLDIEQSEARKYKLFGSADSYGVLSQILGSTSNMSKKKKK